MSSPPRIDVLDQAGIRVIRFKDARLYDDFVVREVIDQLTAALPETGEIALVLDFSGVEAISSSMLGKLILLQRRIDAKQGRMRLCHMNKTVRAVFRSTNLDRLFQIDNSLNEALSEAAGS